MAAARPLCLFQSCAHASKAVFEPGHLGALLAAPLQIAVDCPRCLSSYCNWPSLPRRFDGLDKFHPVASGPLAPRNDEPITAWLCLSEFWHATEAADEPQPPGALPVQFKKML
jgi:hypothetical protein